MIDFKIRLSDYSDIPTLKRIWNCCFTDSKAETDRFFDSFFTPGFSLLLTANGNPAAAAYLIDTGRLIIDSRLSYKCAYIYGVGVIPSYRNHGFGVKITEAVTALSSELGFNCCALVPADLGLFRYYRDKVRYHKCFCIDEHSITLKHNYKKEELLTITEDEYSAIRESFLTGIAHIRFNQSSISYAGALLTQSGGGFLKTERAEIAAVELTTNCALVKEMLCAPDAVHDFAQNIMRFFHRGKCVVRRPGHSKPFAMLNRNLDLKPYFGFAFD